MTELTVSIFQRTEGRNISWTTIGLGRFNRHESASTTGKLADRIRDRLRQSLEKCWPQEIFALEFIRGRRLEMVRLELRLEREEQRQRIQGIFPLILEPRTRGVGKKESPLWRVFHPMRQQEWFVHEENRDLNQEASRYFSQVWAELDNETIDALRVQPKDRLHVISLSFTCKSLQDHLRKKEDSEKDKALLGSTRRSGDVLAELGTNQTIRAIDRRLASGVPRDPYRQRLQHLLCGKQKSSVLLIGPSGVGKSTLIAQLIYDLLDADEYPLHRNLDNVHKVWQIRGRRIIAGMSYLGQWEARCVELMEKARERQAILWVQDIHAWGRIGESRESDRCLATFFRGPVARQELVLIGECTAGQFQQLQHDAPSFASAFTHIYVESSDERQTMALLLHEARALEQRQPVAFSGDFFRSLLDLAKPLNPNIAEPGKSLELLRTIADSGISSHELKQAAQAADRGEKITAIKIYRDLTGSGLKESKEAVEEYLQTGSWPFQRPTDPTNLQERFASKLEAQLKVSSKRRRPGPDSILRLISNRTGMPLNLINSSRKITRKEINQHIEAYIKGQPEAVRVACDLILKIKSGLVDPHRPYAVLLFTGPTGTGKTEMAKCIASYLYGQTNRLLRIDMNEYNSFDGPARLIGDRFQPEGSLTSHVQHQPFCVVLLDEIDKAHPSVLNLMLQLFDDGRLTDAHGNLVNFCHTVIIMTSNLGAQTNSSLGFSNASDSPAQETAKKFTLTAVQEFFPPELFNRIDRIVTFEPLTKVAAQEIARAELTRMFDRRGLRERNILVHFTDAVVDKAVEEGFQAGYGARSLKRYLEDHIGAYLADVIASQKASEIRIFWLYVHQQKLKIHTEQLVEIDTHLHRDETEDFLDWTLTRLQKYIPTAFQKIEEMLTGRHFTALAATLEESLARFHLGDVHAADTVFTIDTLRQQMLDIREKMQIQLEYDPRVAKYDESSYRELLAETLEHTLSPEIRQLSYPFSVPGQTLAFEPRLASPRLSMHKRSDFLKALAELWFLERSLETAHQPEKHAVILELKRISQTQSTDRFSHETPGLLEWLAKAYLQGRGTIDGKIAAITDSYQEHPSFSSTGDEFFTKPQQCIVMRMAGPAVYEFYRNEHGCHIRHSLSGNSEVVRVRVLSDNHCTAQTHLENLRTTRQFFIDNLECYGEHAHPREHAEALLPIVRRYFFDAPPPSARTNIEVEDYLLLHTLKGQVYELAEIFPSLWLLHMCASFGRST